MNTKQNFIRLIFFFLCFGGLSYQLGQISSRYFKFQTRSEVQLSVPESITVPLMSTCWYLKDVMIRKRFKNLPEYYAAIDPMTVEQVFNEVPDIKDILDEELACSIRLPNEISAKFPYSNRSECLSMFKIERYLQRDFLCYKFIPKIIDPKRQLDLLEYTLAPQAPGTVYRLFMNKTLFGDQVHFAMFTHSPTTSHIHDSIFSSTYSSVKMRENKLGVLMIKVSSNSVIIERLQSPYDTSCKCFNDGLSGIEYMSKMFQEESIQNLGRVPLFLPIEDEKLQYPLMTASILRNKTFLSQFNQIYKKYNQSYSDCKLEYQVSRISVNFGGTVTVGVYWPQDSRSVMKHIPVYDLIDFLLYVCSSFGIWFGLSIFSISNYISSFTSSSHVIDGKKKTHFECLCKKSNILLHTKILALMKYMKLRLDMIEE